MEKFTAPFIKSPAPFCAEDYAPAPAQIFIRQFNLNKKGEATLCFCPLGYGYCFINGKSVTEDLLLAPVSEYDKLLWYNVYDVTHLLKEGENVAVVGPSGGGKTTMCSLLSRFYDVSGGEILIDGKNIKDMKLSSLRNIIGTVQQEVYMFSGTVRENIIYGKPDATDEEMIQAAKLAGAHDFISKLSDGYDTFIGERGTMLSGGQKQRISIARVFLKNPPVLVLDEATSALDNESEEIIKKSLESLSKGRTTFTVAHRLTTVKNADRIFVLTEKGIEEEGSHEELISRGGIYARLYRG